jgi:flagellar basal-body rod protein FlgF
MGSGKYSALAGAISREHTIANITNNLANVNTSGYKKSMVSFETVLKGEQQANEAKGINHNRIRNNYTDFSQGAIRTTADPLDMVIHGEGFFKLQGGNGILYSRRGDMAINAEGLLTTGNGLPVLDEGGGRINIPDTDTSQIAVGDDGTIYLLGLEGAREEVAKLGIVDISDKQQLKRESDTTFSLQDSALEIPSENSRVIQGSLELSNVDMASEMARLIDSHRVFETYHKVLKSYSTIGEQQEELGTLG